MVVAVAVDVVVVVAVDFVVVAVDFAAVAAEAAVAVVAAAAGAFFGAAAATEAAAYRGASAVFADPRRALRGFDKRIFFWPGTGSDPANSCSHHRDLRARATELADNKSS